MPSFKKKYKYPVDWYARQYNLSTSTIARYQKEGAPFDDPDKFIRWMAPRSHKPKHMRDPVGIRDLRVNKLPKATVRSAKTPTAPQKKDGKGDIAQAPENPSGGHPRITSRPIIKGGGLRVEIARQEAECAHAYELYRQAVDCGDNMDAMALHKIWIGAQEQLRKLSKDVPKSEKDDDKVLPIGDVEHSWRTAMGQMKTMLENVPATVSIGLVGVSPEVRVQVEKAMMDEIVIVTSALRETPWIR